ncbi:MAG: flagellar hook protein FlgE [Chloroflexi bacterium]|nr:flagellar hook protein FlgE [Chloroflexota bacterium]
MLRSMYSAISSLGLHQTYMDVVANNLANVNTTAYKASRVDFKIQISQFHNPGNAPSTTATPPTGGRNPIQAGMGTQLGGIVKIMTQGTLRATGRPTDIAIQDDGFFIVGENVETGAFTRDGAFDVGQDRMMTHMNTGLHVLGWDQGDVDPDTGLIDTTGAVGPIAIPVDTTLARATANVTLAGNLDAATLSTSVPNYVDTTMAVYDSQGNQHNVTLRLTKTATANQWTAAVTGTYANPPFASAPTLSATTLIFDVSGQLSTAGSTTGTLTIDLVNGAGVNQPPTDPGTITIDFSELTQLGQTSTVSQVTQDGLAPGTLSSLDIVSETGRVFGLYSNSLRQELGQIALATFINPAGLISAGQNLYRAWINSGDPNVGLPGTGTRGTVVSGHLEGSNVDLAQEFTNMITAQRGFQANSRVITASDEMLQELMSMKR